MNHSLFIALVDFETHTVLVRDNTEVPNVCWGYETKKHCEHCFVKCETMKQCSIFGRTRVTSYFCGNVGKQIRNFLTSLITEEHKLDARCDDKNIKSRWKWSYSRKNLIVHLFLIVHFPWKKYSTTHFLPLWIRKPSLIFGSQSKKLLIFGWF